MKYPRGEGKVQNKTIANKETIKAKGAVNKHAHSKPTNNNKGVRTKSYKKMKELFLNNPNSVTRDEFLSFQSAIGYRRAVSLLEEGKKRLGSKMQGNKGKGNNTGLPDKEPPQMQIGQHNGDVIQKKSFFGKLFSGAKNVVSNVVKQGAKAGANGIKTVGNIVKQGTKAGANSLKTVGNIVKQGAKAGANGLKTVGNIVKQGAKAGANGLKTVGNIVKQGVKAGENGLKTASNLIEKGVKYGQKGLKIANTVLKQGIKLGIDKGKGIIEKAKKQLSQAGGITQNLSKRCGKFFNNAINHLKKSPKMIFDVFKSKSISNITQNKTVQSIYNVLKGSVKLPFEFGKNVYENFNKNDNMEWNDKLMYAFKKTSLFKSFVKITQSGAMQSVFDFAGFDRDEKGVYHAQQNALQIYGGYNNLYDIVFDLATSMDAKKFPFKAGDEEYIVWLWKGDYLNLGAGAETGVYSGGEPHWIADESLAMPMTLSLQDKQGNKIFEYKPNENTWWCTGFNPQVQDAQATNLIAIGSIDFSGKKELWDSFYKKYRKYQKEVKWTFDTEKKIAYFKWESPK